MGKKQAGMLGGSKVGEEEKEKEIQDGKGEHRMQVKWYCEHMQNNKGTLRCVL